MTPLGLPRLHLREVGSTSDRARELAAAGAPHGTLVTAEHQVAGRGRQGRSWTTPPRGALAMSLVLREFPLVLPLVAGVAVAEAIGPGAALKWPNDVLVDGRKVAGILAEGRPSDGWAVLGIGVNVAVREDELPPELRERAGTLGRSEEDVEVLLTAILIALARWLAAPQDALLGAWQARDALAGRHITWTGGSGVANGIDDDGRLVVDVDGGGRTALEAGEVHLGGRV
jgi:BirA family biotin operon repressor/biotin-[acetyl-CoA-carboxylase] ligase